MPSPNPTWYFLVLTTTLGILATGVVYVIGANLLNWLIPGTVTGQFPLNFFPHNLLQVFQ